MANASAGFSYGGFGFSAEAFPCNVSGGAEGSNSCHDLIRNERRWPEATDEKQNNDCAVDQCPSARPFHQLVTTWTIRVKRQECG